ncbi:MAG: HPr family phosphocarrier protein, partial [Propionibacteriaceae bacterium]|nr:HPr family phosphocarrier protein [Propionibacteriaceae bacterium]
MADPSARTFTWTIRNAHGLHARPAAALVSGLRGLDASVTLSNATLGKGPVPAGSLTSVQTLGLRKGDVMTAVITGAGAEQACDRLAQLAQDDFGEREAPAAAVAVAATGHTGRQIAIGPVRHVAIDPDTSGYVPGAAAVEADRLAAAVAQVEQVLATGAGGDIYAVQGLILADEETQAHLRAAIGQGSAATDAVRAWFTAAADGLEALDDPYLKARAEDQRGVQRMLLRALCGQQVAPGAAEGILVLDELDPVTAGSLDAQRCQGVITLAGGATGHGAILAQARGFALATGHAEVAGVPDGTVVAIDPVDNRVWVDPDQALLDDLRARQAARESEAADAERLAAQPALTRSGRRVLVEANLSSVADAVAASAAGAEGSGLVRTEVLFGGWDHAPSAQEQADIFVQIGRALPAGVITVRTWDPGGDKPLAFLPQDPETNPMLGERGVRAMRRLPQLLDEQLTAILLASRE